MNYDLKTTSTTYILLNKVYSRATVFKMINSLFQFYIKFMICGTAHVETSFRTIVVFLIFVIIIQISIEINIYICDERIITVVEMN